MKITIALIAISLASPAMANCEPEFRGPFYIHTHAGDMKRTAECRQVPQCQQVGTGKMVNCYSPAKIERTYRLLKGQYERDYIVSIEMSRGKFKDARGLAEAVRRGN